jgi:hypothetical protein
MHSLRSSATPYALLNSHTNHLNWTLGKGHLTSTWRCGQFQLIFWPLTDTEILSANIWHSLWISNYFHPLTPNGHLSHQKLLSSGVRSVFWFQLPNLVAGVHPWHLAGWLWPPCALPTPAKGHFLITCLKLIVANDEDGYSLISCFKL